MCLDGFFSAFEEVQKAKKPLNREIQRLLVPIGGYSSDPAGIRTQDPYIKSVMLYRLSYGIVLPTLAWDYIFFAGIVHPKVNISCAQIKESNS